MRVLVPVFTTETCWPSAKSEYFPRIPSPVLPRTPHPLLLLLSPAALMSASQMWATLHRAEILRIFPDWRCCKCSSSSILRSSCFSSSPLGRLCVATAGQLWIVEQSCFTLEEGLWDVHHVHGERFSLQSGISCENKNWHARSGLNLENCHFILGTGALRCGQHFPASAVQCHIWFCFVGTVCRNIPVFVMWGCSRSNIWFRMSVASCQRHVVLVCEIFFQVQGQELDKKYFYCRAS